MRHETEAVVGHALMERETVACIVVELGFRTLSHHDFGKFNECPLLPSLWDTTHNLCVFVAGEAEVNEPPSVKKPRRLFQQRNPLAVFLDQIVVGGQYVRNGHLLIQFGK